MVTMHVIIDIQICSPNDDILKIWFVNDEIFICSNMWMSFPSRSLRNETQNCLVFLLFSDIEFIDNMNKLYKRFFFNTQYAAYNFFSFSSTSVVLHKDSWSSHSPIYEVFWLLRKNFRLFKLLTPLMSLAYFCFSFFLTKDPSYLIHLAI